NLRIDDVWALVGNTPHLRVPTPARNGSGGVYIKLEGCNPTGSLKDRACVGLLRDSQASGALLPGTTILDASSGNMGCALAYCGRLLGHAVKVVSSSKLSEDKRSFMHYYGAEVEQAGDFTIDGNQLCRRWAAAEPERYCFTDQLHSWANPRAHYATTGP